MSWEVWDMNLKASFFNTALFKSNLKRFWWISAGIFAAFLAVALLFLVDEHSADGYLIMNGVLMVIAGLLPPILFSYLNSAGSVSCMHALPVKRRAHFLTNTASVFFLVLAPAAVCYAIGLIYSGAEGLSLGLRLIKYFASMLLCITISSAAGTLGAMITGNTIAAIVFGIIFFTFPFYFEATIYSFLNYNLYGLWNVDYYAIEHFSLMEINAFMICFFAAAVIEYIASWLLYKNRRLETNGDIISFKFLKPVFIAGVALFAGLIGYFYLSEFFERSIFLMLPFGIAGIVVSYMLAKKAFTVKGMWKPIVIYCVFVTMVYFTVTYDLTGYERRVPDVADIKSIDLVIEENINHKYYVDGKYYTRGLVSAEDFRYNNEKDFENITALHRYCIENRSSNGIRQMPIVYNLKNGKTLKRIYNVSLYRDAGILKPIMCTEQAKKLEHNWLVNEPKINVITIEDERMGDKAPGVGSIDGGSERAKLLTDALKADLAEASYENIAAYNNSRTSITINYEEALYDGEGNVLDKEKNPLMENVLTDTFGIPQEYKRTTELLKQWGVYDDIYKAEDASRVVINTNFEMGQNETEITDAAQIKELYDFMSEAKYIQREREYDGIYDLRLEFYNADGEKLFESGDMLCAQGEYYPDVMETELKRAKAGYAERKETATVEVITD